MTRAQAGMIRPLLSSAIKPDGAIEQRSEPRRSSHLRFRAVHATQDLAATAPPLPQTNFAPGELFVTLQPQVAGIARALLGELPAAELLHDICVDAAMSAARFRGDSAFSSWLYAVVRQHVHKWIRTERRRKSMLREFGHQSLIVTPVQPDDVVSGQRLAIRLNEALATLPKRQRTCLVLVQFEDRSVNDVAELLGITAEAVRMNVHRARCHLRAWIQAHGKWHERWSDP